MFIIPVFVAPSPISGVGVFTRTNIEKGQLIWRFDERFDLIFTEEEWNTIPFDVRNELEIHAWRSVIDGPIYYESTAGRFINHSRSPNTDFTREGLGFARERIPENTELTSDYREFMADCSHLDFI